MEKIVYFDDECGFCRWCVAFVLKRTKAFSFQSITEIPGSPYEHLWDGKSILLAGKEVFLGGTAATAILKEIGGIWKWSGGVITALHLQGILYRFLARSRKTGLLPAYSKENLLLKWPEKVHI